MNNKNKISLVSLGCAKNLVDSEMLIGGLKSENYDIVNKREGDPSKVIASSNIAYDKLGWEPKFSDIETILQSMWNIYKAL